MTEDTAAGPGNTLAHPLTRMVGRDPAQRHRASTPLELLFDLTFVLALSEAANQFAHLIADGHVGPAIVGFLFAMFAICWAWINFSWFASAYDTDDWFYRLTTMVQMIGVIILALGQPALFHSLDEGVRIDNGLVVAGYVIMRLAMVSQWTRVAREDPARRRAARTYIFFIVLAQFGWVVTAVVDLPLAAFFTIYPVLLVIEFVGPIVAERRSGGTPWHAEHMAERFGLFAIIALGEGVVGTLAPVSALVEEQGWTMDSALVIVAGVGLTFGLWWMYFILPSGPILARFRSRAFAWGYVHIPLFASIAATGAGLHVAAYVIEQQSEIGVTGATIAIVIPVISFAATLFLLNSILLRQLHRINSFLFVGMVAVAFIAVVLAATGASLAVCLIVITLAPTVVVLGFETIGRRAQASTMERTMR